MPDRLGILPNSPLIYVLASVRFAPWRLLGKKIDEIQDELREWAPMVNNIRLSVPDPTEPGRLVEEEAWFLTAADRSFGYYLASNQLVFLTTKYASYADFAIQMQRGLTSLIGKMRFIDVTHIGVRYIDHIRPLNLEPLTHYLAASLLCPPVPGLEEVGGQVQRVYLVSEPQVGLRLQCRYEPGLPVTPEELLPLILALDPSSRDSIPAIEAGQAVLDIDSASIKMLPMRMTEAEIGKDLHDLHVHANRVFRHESIYTDHAFSIWGDES